ncbi:MAG: hypothetical protein GY731_08610 [Gammaproteobacteria bacterium]|nr:hypothetical protein [Gammaproteobacteria bacterium]
MNGDIYLNIDTITLRGLDHIDRHALKVALQQVLREQLSSNPNLRNTGLAQVQTDITLPPAYGAEQFGQILGDSICDVITTNEDRTLSTKKTQQGGGHNA